MANDHVATLARVSEDLERLGYRYALVGGLAVSAVARGRLTKDVDLTVLVNTDQEAEALVLGLRNNGYTLVTALEHTPSGRLSTVRMLLPHSLSREPDVDFLFCSCGIEREIVEAATPLTVLGRKIPVATRWHLIAMKVLSEREERVNDKADILELLKKCSQDDLEQVNEALRLITERGFARDKNLAAELSLFMDIAGLRWSNREQGP